MKPASEFKACLGYLWSSTRNRRHRLGGRLSRRKSVHSVRPALASWPALVRKASFPSQPLTQPLGLCLKFGSWQPTSDGRGWESNPKSITPRAGASPMERLNLRRTTNNLCAMSTCLAPPTVPRIPKFSTSNVFLLILGTRRTMGEPIGWSSDHVSPKIT